MGARESRIVNHHICGGTGGNGGVGGEQGGSGGPGEGPRPTYNIHTRNLKLSVTNHKHSTPHPLPGVPPDFPRIPLVEIDLRREIRVDPVESSYVFRVVNRSHVRRVRRWHYARIDGRESDMTVAMYEGDHAKRNWFEDISPYFQLRHPHLLQLFGVAISSGKCAAVFRDELIPFKLFYDRFKDATHVKKVYLWAYWASDFHLAKEYVQMMLHRKIYPQASSLWIRSSTGRLCAEPSEDSYHPCYILPRTPREWTPPESDYFAVLDEARPENYMALVSSMSLELYHSICWKDSCDDWFIEIPLSEISMVRIGAIIFCPSSTQSLDSQGRIVAFNGPVLLYDDGWECIWGGLTGELLDNGWTRFSIHNERHVEIEMKIYCEGVDQWLSQANHIFDQLHVNSNHHDYGYTESCNFRLEFSPTGSDVPRGYLFVCPREDLQVGPSSFRWPDCPAYWSRDPDGLDPIHTEEAARLGYPTAKLSSPVRFRSWDSDVYIGLRQFHEAKGFDADSQELARHLGHSLFKLADPALAPISFKFRYGRRVFADDDDSDDDETPDPLALRTPNISDVAEDSDVEEDELRLSAL